MGEVASDHKKIKLAESEELSVEGGLALEVEKKFVWRILNYDKLHEVEGRINSQQFEFEVGSIGPDFPRSKWRFFLQVTHLAEDIKKVKRVCVCARFAEPLDKSAQTEAKLLVVVRVRVEKDDGSKFFDRTTELKELNIFRGGGWGYGLFQLADTLEALPLQADGTLMIHLGMKIFSQNRMDWRSATNARPEASIVKTIQSYASLLESGECADVTIHAGDGTLFKAHRAFLSARSPVFRSMFLSGMQEDKTGEVEVKDLSGKGVNHLLRFIYVGEVLPYVVDKDDATEPCISEVLYGATKYQLEDLVEHIDNTMGSLCDQKNVKFLLQLANKFGLKKAQEAVKKFAACHPIAFDSIMDSL